jgi:nicotinamidase-related amidase
MVRTDSPLHGNAPDKATVALLIIDMINDLEFDEGDLLLPMAMEAAKNLASLKRRFAEANLPVIYANDNFGRWQSNFRTQVDHCLQDNVRGQPLVQLLTPEENDYFVLKAKHSAFYCTTLDLLLDYLHVEKLVISGIATDMCILFTSSDAYMRDFKILIPRDCVAANTAKRSEDALELMQRVLKADLSTSTEINLEALMKPCNMK